MSNSDDHTRIVRVLDKKDILDRNKKEEKERKKDHYKQLNRIEEKKNLQPRKDKSLKDTKKKEK